MQDYQPNSHRSKEQAAENAKKERKVQKVVKGPVTTKKNTGRKLLNTFISEDASNVKNYILRDVLVPAISNTILDIITNSANMIFGGHDRSKRGSVGTKISYRSYYDDKKDYRYDRDRERRNNEIGRFDYDDIVFSTRGDAEIVREHMLDTVTQYGMVRIDDMYEFAGLTAPYTANRYGWMGLRDIEIVRVYDGYILKLPKAMPID